MKASNLVLASIPLLPSIIALASMDNDAVILIILKLLLISTFGYILTVATIPVVATYTLKKGLYGKDLGKKGTITESKDIPEALGIVTGTSFLVCTIISQLLFATNYNQLTIFNSALFSICFMIFLGFTDDTLDLKWRYKLILPTVASLPLLVSYTGPTALYIPGPLRFVFMSEGQLTTFGHFVNMIAVVDLNADGTIIELGYLFLVYMGLLAVFCTNAINIYAGINGLECGQSYIIGCSILFFKLFEIQCEGGNVSDDQMFSLVFAFPFVATSLGLLKFNWFPAQVFVGDTFCYFAGMTFAVLGIHGHFSKTLLLLFIPQIINFVYSIPQLFKLIPCPRHRLPRVDVTTGLMYYSAFPCEADQYALFKVRKDDKECPNCTLICIVLRCTGPVSERTLCVILLSLQVFSSCLAFYVRYVLFGTSY